MLDGEYLALPEKRVKQLLKNLEVGRFSHLAFKHVNEMKIDTVSRCIIVVEMRK